MVVFSTCYWNSKHTVIMLGQIWLSIIWSFCLACVHFSGPPNVRNSLHQWRVLERGVYKPTDKPEYRCCTCYQCLNQKKTLSFLHWVRSRYYKLFKHKSAVFEQIRFILRRHYRLNVRLETAVLVRPKKSCGNFRIHFPTVTLKI